MDFSFTEPLPQVNEDEPYLQEDHLSSLGHGVMSVGQLSRESLDTEALRSRHYREAFSNANGRWIFEEKEVDISQEQLGRGNFGKVVVGKWRGCNIACKVLHDSVDGEDGQIVSVNLKDLTSDKVLGGQKIKSLEDQHREIWKKKLLTQELEVLTKLHHPNLTQFLGICVHPRDQFQPTMVLSELCSCSLYDILEIKKYTLDLVEILQISSDMASGLSYLHNQNPQIVHKNLSSKNILMSDSCAKLADFGLSGQDGSKHYAPVVGTAPSGKTVVGSRPATAAAVTFEQQGGVGVFTPTSNSVLTEDGVSDGGKEERPLTEETQPSPLLEVGMPEVISSSTLPYLAPEIVGGSKYRLTEKIDIYSFGVVLLHMITGEFPTPDCREEQLKKATHVESVTDKKKVESGMVTPTNTPKVTKEAELAGSPLRRAEEQEKLKYQDIPEDSPDPAGTTRGAVLSSVLTETLKIMPMHRPSADKLLSLLEEIKYNDRFYPLDRRRPHPQAGMGVITRRWVRQEMANHSKMTTLRLHQMRALLQAEGNRWLKEGRVSEFLQQKLNETSQDLIDVTKIKDAQEIMLTSTQETLRSTQEEFKLHKEKAESLVGNLSKDKQILQDRLLDTDMNLRACIGDYQEAVAALDEVTERLATRDTAVIGMGQTLRNKDTEIATLQSRYDEVDHQNQELEVRLEQALQRWKLNEEEMERGKKSFAKLSKQSANILEKNSKLERERDTLLELIKKQESEVLPDDVLRKIAGLEKELVNSSKANELLVEQKQEMALTIDDLENTKASLSSSLSDSKDILAARDKTISSREAEIVSMKEEARLTAEQNQRVLDEYSVREVGLNMKISKLEKWVESLQKKVSAGIVVDAGQSPESSAKEEKEEEKEEEAPKEEAKHDREEENMDKELARISPGGPKGGAFHFADAVLAKKKTVETQEMLKPADKDRAEKERKAAIRAADSMAKARVRQFEIQEKGSGDGFAGMIAMLKESADDVHICWRACRALRPLLLNNGHPPKQGESLLTQKKELVSFRDIAVGLQCDLVCLDVLREFNDTPGESHLESLAKGQAVQLLGVCAFGNDLVRRRAGENGAMKLIAKVLDFHGSKDEKVLLHCLTTVTNLAHNNQDNRHRFIDAEGLLWLTDCMEAFSLSVKVQRQGCWAMLTLAGSDETARLVADGGGSRALMTLINALLNHPMDPGVQQFGLWATANMALAGADVSRRLRKAGAPEICRIAIENHPRDAEVLRQARHAMGVLQAK